mgnify:CR=1 FL=1
MILAALQITLHMTKHLHSELLFLYPPGVGKGLGSPILSPNHPMYDHIPYFPVVFSRTSAGTRSNTLAAANDNVNPDVCIYIRALLFVWFSLSRLANVQGIQIFL